MGEGRYRCKSTRWAGERRTDRPSLFQDLEDRRMVCCATQRAMLFLPVPVPVQGPSISAVCNGTARPARTSPLGTAASGGSASSQVPSMVARRRIDRSLPAADARPTAQRYTTPAPRTHQLLSQYHGSALSQKNTPGSRCESPPPTIRASWRRTASSRRRAAASPSRSTSSPRLQRRRLHQDCCFSLGLIAAMVGFCVVRKLANRVSGMSKRWMSTDTCVIRGERGDILLPGDMFEPLSAHEARFPLITKIPHGEVIKVDPTRPSLINDHWRPILHSGLLHSLMCKSQKDCIVDAFDYSNVGVLKGCDVLAFKKFDRQVGKINIDHKGYSSFIQELFSRLSGVSNLQRQFKECGNLVSGCETGVDDELLRYSTFFLEGEELAVFYSDAQRLLRQELKHRSNGPEAKRILRELGRRFLNKDVIRECSHHRMFKFHLGSHSPWEKKKKLNEGVPVPDFPGTAVVDVHRIAVTHAIEDNLMGNLMKIHPELSELWSNYSRDDVISALRYMFTDYPDKVLEAFYKVELLDQLQMKRRLPTPKIYKYATPVLGNKEDHQGGARNYNY